MSSHTEKVLAHKGKTITEKELRVLLDITDYELLDSGRYIPQ